MQTATKRRNTVQIQIKALVTGRQDQQLGMVKYLVINSHTSQIIHVVIDPQKQPACPKIIAYSEITHILDGGKTIKLAMADETQLTRLPDFIESNYLSAPGPFGRPSLPFYHEQNQGKIPQGTTHLYPLVAETFLLIGMEPITIRA